LPDISVFFETENVGFSLYNAPPFYGLYVCVADRLSIIGLLYPGLDDLHSGATPRACYFGTLLFLMEHLEGTDPENQMQESYEFLAAWMQEPIIPGSPKAFWQDM
jgi:hypothetical protein